MNVADRFSSYPEWVTGMAAAGLMPDLTPSRYDEEVAQCYQAALSSPKVAKRSTWNGGSDCPSPFYCLAAALSPQSVEQIFETTHQRVTRKIHCSDPLF